MSLTVRNLAGGVALIGGGCLAVTTAIIAAVMWLFTDGSTGSLIADGVMATLGTAVAVWGYRTRAAVSQARCYIGLVTQQRVLSVDRIAQLTGHPDVVAVLSDLQTLIDDGHLPDHVIDFEQRMIQPLSAQAELPQVGAPLAKFDEMGHLIATSGSPPAATEESANP